MKSEIQSSSYVLESLPSQLSNNAHSNSLLESILLSDDACNHDAIIIIEQPGVSFSDFLSLIILIMFGS